MSLYFYMKYKLQDKTWSLLLTCLFYYWRRGDYGSRNSPYSLQVAFLMVLLLILVWHNLFFSLPVQYCFCATVYLVTAHLLKRGSTKQVKFFGITLTWGDAARGQKTVTRLSSALTTSQHLMGTVGCVPWLVLWRLVSLNRGALWSPFFSWCYNASWDVWSFDVDSMILWFFSCSWQAKQESIFSYG